MSAVPEGYEAYGTETRTGKFGQKYDVTLIRPIPNADAHVRKYRAACEAVKRSRIRASRADKRAAIREKQAELRAIQDAFPEWRRAAGELRKIGFNMKRISDVFGVPLSAVKRWSKNEREILDIRSEISALKRKAEAA